MRLYTIALKEIKTFIKNPYIIPSLLVVHFLQFVISINVFRNFVGESTITENTFALIEVIGNSTDTNTIIYYAGFILTQLIAVSSIIVAAFITTEWENNTYNRMLVSPLSKLQISTGIFCGYLTLMLIMSALFVLLTTILYGFNWGNAYFNVFLITILISSVWIIFAMLISNAFKQTKLVASVSTFTVVVLVFLSGGLFAGSVFNRLSKFTIIRWTFDSYIAVIEGKPLSFTLRNLVYIFLTGFVLLVAYVIATRKDELA